MISSPKTCLVDSLITPDIVAMYIFFLIFISYNQRYGSEIIYFVADAVIIDSCRMPPTTEQKSSQICKPVCFSIHIL